MEIKELTEKVKAFGHEQIAISERMRAERMKAIEGYEHTIFGYMEAIADLYELAKATYEAGIENECLFTFGLEFDVNMGFYVRSAKNATIGATYLPYAKFGLASKSWGDLVIYFKESEDIQYRGDVYSNKHLEYVKKIATMFPKWKETALNVINSRIDEAIKRNKDNA